MDISYQLAQLAVQQATKKAEEMKVPVNIVVLDTSGYMKLFVRMDEAFLGSIDIAIPGPTSGPVWP